MWVTTEKQKGCQPAQGAMSFRWEVGEQSLCNPTFWTCRTALLLLTKLKSSFKESGHVQVSRLTPQHLTWLYSVSMS